MKAHVAGDATVGAVPRLGRSRILGLVVLIVFAALLRAGLLHHRLDRIVVNGHISLSAEMARVLLDEGKFAAFDPAVYVALDRHRPYSFHEPAGSVADAVSRSRAGQGTFERSYSVDEGYSLLLAGLWKVTGRRDLLPVRILQALLDLGLVLMMFDAARRLCCLLRAPEHSYLAGMAAAGFLAVHVPHVRMAVNPWYTWWHLAAVIAAQWTLLRGLTSSRRQAAVLAIAHAACMGVFGWIRSLVLPIATLPALFVSWIRGASLPKCAGAAVLAGLVALAMTLPLVGLRKSQWGETRVRRGTLWHTVYASLLLRPDGNTVGDDQQVMREVCERHGLEPTAWEARLGGVQGPEYEEACRTEALKLLREHPGRIVVAWGKRVLALLFTARQEWSTSLPAWIGWLLEVPLYLFGPILGWMLLRRRTTRGGWVALGILSPGLFSDVMAVLLAGVHYQYTLPGRVGSIVWIGALPCILALRRRTTVAAAETE